MAHKQSWFSGVSPQLLLGSLELWVALGSFPEGRAWVRRLSVRLVLSVGTLTLI